jgi:hypothetical protein
MDEKESLFYMSLRYWVSLPCAAIKQSPEAEHFIKKGFVWFMNLVAVNPNSIYHHVTVTPQGREVEGRLATAEAAPHKRDGLLLFIVIVVAF